MEAVLAEVGRRRSEFQGFEGRQRVVDVQLAGNCLRVQGFEDQRQPPPDADHTRGLGDRDRHCKRVGPLRTPHHQAQKVEGNPCFTTA